eukprot:Rhum_TRINITY_DN14236_c0_g1::Rhum_TRINITY_DN14236_c0_g1_i2::g.74663::m.74663/K13811/PAPSS; 3'-phosphoadenosine 5'-phosphosulfate synthase
MFRGEQTKKPWPYIAVALTAGFVWISLGGTKTPGTVAVSPTSAHTSPATPAEPCPSLGQLRSKQLTAVNGKFVSDKFDAVSPDERQDALGQRGATLWMTGLSGSGKSTIGKELERRLVKDDRVHVYRLDGDNLRFGLSRDLTLTAEDRQEAVRRASEVAALMADSGTLAMVSLISPYVKDRNEARELHRARKLPFIEVYVEAPTDEVAKRDPKGLYKLHKEGKIKGMTGFDAPYEAPVNPEVLLKTATCCGSKATEEKLTACKKDADTAGVKFQDHCPSALNECVDSCVAVLRTELVNHRVLTPHTPAASTPCIDTKKPKTAESSDKIGEAMAHADGFPDGTVAPNVIEEDESYWTSDEVTKLQPVPLTDLDVQWMQVIGEGWASPLKGPMRESALVQALHFNSLLVERSGEGGNSLHGPGPAATDFGNAEQAEKMVKNGERVNMPVPIVLPLSSQTRMLINRAVQKGKEAGKRVQLVLVSPAGESVAVLNDPEVYDFRKEEMIARSWGSWDLNHPYIKENIMAAGDYLLGGELSKIRRIKFRDGLDKWRKTPAELLAEFKAKGADGVFAFQTRNPTHAGHAHLMKEGRKTMIKKGYANPVLWLSPLGGWTKGDDVPLDVRVKQHQAVLDEKMLDPAWTVLAIWPSPMVYSGPTEVQWHAKSRRVVGADYFIVGRDPAGLAYSDEYAKEHGQKKGDDVYHADHGRYVLQVSPGMGNMGLLASGAVHYDKTDGEMKPKPDGMSKADFAKQFLKISGSKMRQMGRMMVDVCESLDAIPSDWADKPSCVPPKFMVKTGWDIMRKYYKTKDEADVIANAVMQSKQRPRVAERTEVAYPTKVGMKGEDQMYAVYLTDAGGKKISPWHDVKLKEKEGVYNMVVEFPKGTNAKFEVQKEVAYNPIKQDTKKGLARYYTYGMSFFNNGLFPQTWEDSGLRGEEGNMGDNDPLDVMEIGAKEHPIGSVVPVKILGMLGLIDDDETDYKVIAIAVDDADADKITDIASLRQVKGEAFVERIVDWLRMYKTTDKKDPDAAKPNKFLKNGEYMSAEDAVRVIDETHGHWKKLRSAEKKTEKTKAFWLGAGQ